MRLVLRVDIVVVLKNKDLEPLIAKGLDGPDFHAAFLAFGWNKSVLRLLTRIVGS
jgi:hypothetical protein